jgi:polyhydroxybutyrate depolymerase
MSGLKSRIMVLLGVLILVGSVFGSIAYERFKRSGLVASGSDSFALRFGGSERHYVLHVPRSYDGRTRVPVVMMLHGAGGTAKGAMEETGWTDKADEAGFLTVFPEATSSDRWKPSRFLTNPQVWNDGSGRGHAGLRNIDDVRFVNALIDDLCSRFLVDEKRIFVTGFSNGASMTFRVGAELSGRIAAIAPISGHFWLNISRLDCPVSLIYIIGTEDPLNPLEGGETRTPWGIVEKKPRVEESVLKWARLLECPTEPKLVSDKNGVKVVTYGPGREGSELFYYTIEGMGHTWPGGKSLLPERLVGRTSSKIRATDVIWDFFLNHPKK